MFVDKGPMSFVLRLFIISNKIFFSFSNRTLDLGGGHEKTPLS